MKIFCISIIIFFISLSAFSQDLKKAFEYYNSKNYAKAAIEFEGTLPQAETEYGKEDTSVYTKILFYTANSFDQSHQTEKAILYYKQSISIYTKKNSADNVEYANICDNLAKLYASIDDYKNALPLYLESKQINEHMFGKESVNHASLCSKLASLYQSMGENQKALPLYLEALQIKEKVSGKEDISYAITCINLASLYQTTGEYQKALPFYLESQEIFGHVLGKKHPNYAKSCNNLASLYKMMGDYQKALPLFIEAKQILEQSFGKKHPEYTATCNMLALLYQSMGDYQKALPLFIETKQIREKILGKMHADYAASCNNLGLLYQSMGDYQNALPLLIEAKQINEKISGKEHRNYAISCQSLAFLYKSMGDFQKALPLYMEAQMINEKVLGKEHPDYGNSCDNLAALYMSIGDYQKALPLSIEAKQIVEKAFGKKHPTYGQYINNLAGLYNLMGDTTKALPLYLESMQIIEQTLGKGHPNYASSCNNLAGIYVSMLEYKKALPLYMEAKQIQEKVLGKEHPDYARACNNLAYLYESMGDYKKALPLAIETKQIWEKALGKEHHDYTGSCVNLALLYLSMGETKKAEPLIVEANQNLNKQIRNNFAFLTEKEKEPFIKTISGNFETFHSFALQYKDKKPEFIGLNFNNELAQKGMILQSSKALLEAVMGSGKLDLIANYNELIATKKTLGYQYSLAIDKRTTNTDSLEQIANKLESSLLLEMQKYPELNKYSNFNHMASLQDIHKGLKPGEAAIEFISFKYHDNKRWTDSTYYCALVLCKDFKYPKMIFLCEERQLQALLPTSTGNSGGIDNLYNLEGTISEKENAYSLYNLIWQPIDGVLHGITTIYFAPSGLLHKISFNAIAMPGKNLLSDKYRLHTLSSTAVLVKNQEEFRIDQSSKIQIYGGIKYSETGNEMLKNAEKYKQKDGPLIVSYRPSAVATRGEQWNYLPGTLKEATSINDLFIAAHIPVVFLSAKEANEESFKMLHGKNSPTIIHMATHGFFMPDPKSEYSDMDIRGMSSFKASDNPLFRSGLMFAGSNAAWNNDTIPDGVEDGILTANEISQMYLPNTRLVVLSACETGLGEVKGDEGVFGLQRAFKMAGVEYIIMSLWQVPDQQTSELMQSFYQQLLSGQQIRDAFAVAQNELKVKYKDSPFSWAAFVLIE